MIVNYTDNFKFNTRLTLDNNVLNQVNETRLLGVIISDDLSWHSNSDFIVKKAYKRMIMLHKLYEFSISIEDMLEIYILNIRSILESSAVVWHSSITQAEQLAIERVQKVALRIILDANYVCYENALQFSGLQSLYDRRTTLCKKFALQCTKNDKTSDMFPLNPSKVKTRKPDKYLVPTSSM